MAYDYFMDTFQEDIDKLSSILGNGTPPHESIASLLVDMHDGFLKNIEPGQRAVMINSQIDMIRLYSEFDVPLIVFQHKNRKTIGNLLEEIKKVPRHKFIKKEKKDGFTNPEVEHQLKEWGSEYIILMGINAYHCVKHTAESAIARGFKVITAPTLTKNQSFHSNKGQYGEFLNWIGSSGTLIQDHTTLSYSVCSYSRYNYS